MKKLKRKVWKTSLLLASLCVVIMIYAPNIYFQVLPIFIPSSIITTILPFYMLDDSKKKKTFIEKQNKEENIYKEDNLEKELEKKKKVKEKQVTVQTNPIINNDIYSFPEQEKASSYMEKRPKRITRQ